MRQLIQNLAKEGRRREFSWRYGFNFFPSLRYKLKSFPAAEIEAKKVLNDLNRDGIAVTSVSELFGGGENDGNFAELEAAVRELLENRAAELNDLKLAANDEKAIGNKTFNVELLGSEVNFDPESIFARFALQNVFLNIADAYFGMLVKLRYYNVWYTFATRSKPRESQLWHFDREDNYILKVFLYLKDVDEGAGPFTYAPATHRKGRLWAKHPEQFREGNVLRSRDEQMAAVVPEKNWIRAAGRKGTIVFADTRGYHKGGEARTADRLMYTCMFTSPASQSARLLAFSKEFQPHLISKRQQTALEI